jgi:hypothetical protein
MKLQLDQETLNALDKSIQHWQNYADGKGEEEGYPNEHNCELCNNFFTYPDYCKDCPVKLTTGFGFCETSPYRKAARAGILHGHIDYTTEQFLSAAREELNFLISIRENSELDKKETNL